MKKKLATIFGLSMGTIALATTAIAGSIALTSCTSSDFGLVPLNAGLDSVSSIVQNQINALYDTLDTNARNDASTTTTTVTTDGETTTIDESTPVVKLSDLIAATQDQNFQTQFIQSAVDAINANPDNTPALSNNPLSTNDITKVTFDIWANKQSGFSVVCNIEFNNNIMLSQPDITSSNYSITSQRSISMNPITFDKALVAPTPEVYSKLIGLNGCLNGLGYLNASVFGTAISQLRAAGQATISNVTALINSSAFQDVWKQMAINAIKVFPNSKTQKSFQSTPNYDPAKVDCDVLHSDLNVNDIKSVEFELTTYNYNWGIDTKVVFSDRVVVGLPIDKTDLVLAPGQTLIPPTDPKQPVPSSYYSQYGDDGDHTARVLMVSSTQSCFPKCFNVLLNADPLSIPAISSMFNTINTQLKDLYTKDPDNAISKQYLNNSAFQSTIKTAINDELAKLDPPVVLPENGILNVDFKVDNTNPDNPSVTPVIVFNDKCMNIPFIGLPNGIKWSRDVNSNVLLTGLPVALK